MALRIGGSSPGVAFAESAHRVSIALATAASEGVADKVRPTPDARKAGWERGASHAGESPAGPEPPRPLGGGVYIGSDGEVVVDVQDGLLCWSANDWRTWNRLGVDDRIESINLENYAEGPREPEPLARDPSAVPEGRSPETSVDPPPPGAPREEERGLLPGPHARDGPWHRGRDPTLELGGSGHDVGDPLVAWLDVPAPGPAKHPHWVEPPAEGHESATHLDVER